MLASFSCRGKKKKNGWQEPSVSRCMAGCHVTHGPERLQSIYSEQLCKPQARGSQEHRTNLNSISLNAKLALGFPRVLHPRVPKEESGTEQGNHQNIEKNFKRIIKKKCLDGPWKSPFHSPRGFGECKNIVAALLSSLILIL